jgi:hypothetical protein
VWGATLPAMAKFATFDNRKTYVNIETIASVSPALSYPETTSWILLVDGSGLTVDLTVDQVMKAILSGI